MRYCKAYPVKKMIPASSSQLVSPCFAGPEGCGVYQHVKSGKPLVEPVPAPEPTRETPPPPKEEAAEQKYCVWVRQEIVSFRPCTRNYDCGSCQFEQMLADRDGKYVEPPQMMQEVERLRQLPTTQRRCKYTVTGKTLTKPCGMDYECWRCSTYQQMRTSIVENCIAEAKPRS